MFPISRFDPEAADTCSFDVEAIPDEDIHVTGTLIWYYCICRRQVWLMAHQINPDEDDPNIEYGRFLQRFSYSRDRKEVSVGSSRFDLIARADGTIIVAEVKKSSRFEKSAVMQLLFYLRELESRGVKARGELRIPEEKRKVSVELTETALRELASAEAEILSIVTASLPPVAEKTRWCSNCGYRDFCWS